MNKVLKTSAPSAPSVTVLIIKHLETKQMGADEIYLLRGNIPIKQKNTPQNQNILLFLTKTEKTPL